MDALVIDDSRATRAMIGRLLGHLGYPVREAADGREGLARLAERRPRVVLVDWNMPNMNGLEFIRAVRADPSYRDLPVVMVTTEAEMSQVVRAMAAGANEYVMKPFTADVLFEKLALVGVEAV
ncbi:MAG: response regulator [Fimbriiglobus sp.]|jgi:two-component system chemotaxis response regulator CheY|nr:response regulator [Fimbriiglobus sp.]